MSSKFIVEYADTITDVIAFSVMLIMTAWTLIKYRKQSKDYFFVFSLCMYPLSYFFLMVGAIYFLNAKKNTTDLAYDFITKNVVPLNNLVMCTIEQLLCFEMQLIRVKLTTDDPIQYMKKILFMKILRFIVILFSFCFNLLQIVQNNYIDLNTVFEQQVRNKDLDFSHQLYTLQILIFFNFAMTLFWDLVFAVLLIINVEFFMQSFWKSRLLIAGLTDQTNLAKLKNDNIALHSSLFLIKKKFVYLRLLVWLIILRETIVTLLQFSYIIDLAQTFFFQTLNYVNRSFLECSLDLIEFLGLCWLYRTQYHFSKKREQESENEQNTFETLAQSRLDSEKTDDTCTPKNNRGKKIPQKTKKTGAKAKQSASVGNASINHNEDLEFEEDIMIKNQDFSKRIKHERAVSKLQGFSVEEDETQEGASSNGENLEIDRSLSDPLIEREWKNSVLDELKKNSFTRKVDIFDGRLEQFNKFLESVVQPQRRKSSIASNKSALVQNQENQQP